MSNTNLYLNSVLMIQQGCCEKEWNMKWNIYLNEIYGNVIYGNVRWEL